MLIRVPLLLQEAQLENMKLKKQLDEVRKQLESEALARVDMENRCQSLKEELDFKTNVSAPSLSYGLPSAEGQRASYYVLPSHRAV